MKRIFPLILVITILLTAQLVPVSADNSTASYALTAEDEKRLMDYKIPEGPYLITNDKLKELVGNYSIYLQVAEEYMELNENYDYKKISTETGKKEYLAGYERYSPFTGSFLKKEEDSKISYITNNKLIKESAFVTSDNCIFLDGSGATTVRGVLCFMFAEIGGSVNVHGKEVKPGIQYKVDVVLFLSGHPDFTEPTQFKVNGYGYISDPTATIPSSSTFSASPTSSKVLVNGKAVDFEAYNINGSNYFKLRDLAMAVNGTEKQFEVGWDGAKNAINLTTNKTYTAAGGELLVSANPSVKEAKPTTSKIYLDGQEVSFTAYNINGNNYFKLRDVGKAINFSVTWDGKTNTIGIDTSTIYAE